MTLLTPDPTVPVSADPVPAGHRYAAVLTAPLVPRLLAGTIVARLPSAMAPILVLLAEVRSGAGYGTAAALAALQALAASVGQPLLARRADRRGHRPVLVAATAATSVVFLALALGDSSLAVTAVLVLLSGLLAPPVQACLKARWRELVAEDVWETAVTIDTSASELVYIAAPVLASAAVYGIGPACGYLLAAGIGLLGTAVVCSAPGPGTRAPLRRDLLGPLRSPALLWMLPVHLAIGAALGTVPLAGLLIATRAGHPGSAGEIPALYAVGSLLGGLLYGLRRWPGRPARHFLAATGLLALTWVPVLACGVPWMAALAAVLPGAALTPALTSGQVLAQQKFPGHQAEVAGWLIAAWGLGESVAVCAAGHWPSTWWPLLTAGGAALIAAPVLVLLHRSPDAPAP